MKPLILFGILTVLIFVLGTISLAGAHPHVTIDLMESHSHDPNDENFQDVFILHDFEHVILSTWEFFRTLIFG